MMGMHCGDSIPPRHGSSSNVILIHFQTDGSVTNAGFKMEYNPMGKQNTLVQNTTEWRWIQNFGNILNWTLVRLTTLINGIMDSGKIEY